MSFEGNFDFFRSYFFFNFFKYLDLSYTCAFMLYVLHNHNNRWSLYYTKIYLLSIDRTACVAAASSLLLVVFYERTPTTTKVRTKTKYLTEKYHTPHARFKPISTQNKKVNIVPNCTRRTSTYEKEGRPPDIGT